MTYDISDRMTEHDREIAEHRRRLRRFEVVGVEYVTPAILGLVALATLLTDQKGWLASICGAVIAFAIASFVTRRFFVH